MEDTNATSPVIVEVVEVSAPAAPPSFARILKAHAALSGAAQTPANKGFPFVANPIEFLEGAGFGRSEAVSVLDELNSRGCVFLRGEHEAAEDKIPDTALIVRAPTPGDGKRERSTIRFDELLRELTAYADVMQELFRHPLLGRVVEFMGTKEWADGDVSPAARTAYDVLRSRAVREINGFPAVFTPGAVLTCYEPHPNREEAERLLDELEAATWIRRVRDPPLTDDGRRVQPHALLLHTEE